MSIMNELLFDICTAYGGSPIAGEARNDLLLCIANDLGASIRNPNIRNMILEDILTRLTTTLSDFDSDFDTDFF